MILGTAQIGMNYGITNSRGKIDYEELNNIIKFCCKNDLLEFDTAFGYGDAHERLSRILKKYCLKKTTITTKIGLIDFSEYDLIKKKILGLKLIFPKSNLNLLCHDEKILLKKNNLLLRNLFKLKEDKIIKKIGVSVYSMKLALKGLNNKKIDIVQVSSNILDQRVLNKKFLNYKKKLYFRSIFLQGTLITKRKYQNKIFNKKINLLNNISKKFNLTKVELCIYYILKMTKIKKFIVGIESSTQLRELYEVFIKIKKFKIDRRIIKELKLLSCNNLKIIDPRKW